MALLLGARTLLGAPGLTTKTKDAKIWDRDRGHMTADVFFASTRHPSLGVMPPATVFGMVAFAPQNG